MIVMRIAVMAMVWCTALNVSAQVTGGDKVKPEDMVVDMNEPTMEPRVKVTRVLDKQGDSIQCVQLNRIYVYPAIAFKDEKQQQQYNQLVKNVKRVLPIAKEVNGIIIETYEYLQTLPDKKAKDQHMKKVEEAIKRQYSPRMKKLTFSQGKLLIKLIHRECNSSSYQLVQAFLGPVKAGFYQAFAWAFGASLTKKYDPKGKDRLTERVVLMVEAGQL
ncbi:DUF4294 domain-containing protein [Prevotella sp. OH937_COT-195]|uniref:DUF4294 domain-containing protein n=1 Tax=Prevotella sp. OH937_COT-195 TaxID=2491051 RepID=UPI00397A1074